MSISIRDTFVPHVHDYERYKCHDYVIHRAVELFACALNGVLGEGDHTQCRGVRINSLEFPQGDVLEVTSTSTASLATRASPAIRDIQHGHTYEKHVPTVVTGQFATGPPAPCPRYFSEGNDPGHVQCKQVTSTEPRIVKNINFPITQSSDMEISNGTIAIRQIGNVAHTHSIEDASFRPYHDTYSSYMVTICGENHPGCHQDGNITYHEGVSYSTIHDKVVDEVRC